MMPELWGRLRSWWSRWQGKSAITPEMLDRLERDSIETVIFCKHDELTTELICCDIETADGRWFFHEEVEGWELLIQHLEKLPGFRPDWFTAVSQPAFEPCETVAFKRA